MCTTLGKSQLAIYAARYMMIRELSMSNLLIVDMKEILSNIKYPDYNLSQERESPTEETEKKVFKKYVKLLTYLLCHF